LGLFSMFAMVQKAFRGSLKQVDVLEGGRTTVELLSLDLGQLTPCYRSNAANFYTYIPYSTPLLQALPGGNNPANPINRTNILQDVFILKRENMVWQGVGYFVR